MKEEKYYEGIFCDIDKTFLIDGQINEKVFRMLKDYEKQEKKIHLWTGGGSIDIFQKMFKNFFSIEWTIFDKHDFAGCEVEIVIDDMPEEEFTKIYEIKFKKYIRV